MRNRFMLKKLLPNICIILSLMLITFGIVDGFNPGMNFVGNNFFKIILYMDGVAAILTSALFIIVHKNNYRS